MIKMAQQKEYTYDNRYDNLVIEVEASRKGTDKKCQCFFQNPAPVQVGTQSDRHGNVEPLYVQVSTCNGCGAKEIF